MPRKSPSPHVVYAQAAKDLACMLVDLKVACHHGSDLRIDEAMNQIERASSALVLVAASRAGLGDLPLFAARPEPASAVDLDWIEVESPIGREAAASIVLDRVPECTTCFDPAEEQAARQEVEAAAERSRAIREDLAFAPATFDPPRFRAVRPDVEDFKPFWFEAQNFAHAKTLIKILYPVGERPTVCELIPSGFNSLGMIPVRDLIAEAVRVGTQWTDELVTSMEEVITQLDAPPAEVIDKPRYIGRYIGRVIGGDPIAWTIAEGGIDEARGRFDAAYMAGKIPHALQIQSIDEAAFEDQHRRLPEIKFGGILSGKLTAKVARKLTVVAEPQTAQWEPTPDIVAERDRVLNAYLESDSDADFASSIALDVGDSRNSQGDPIIDDVEELLTLESDADQAEAQLAKVEPESNLGITCSNHGYLVDVEEVSGSGEFWAFSEEYAPNLKQATEQAREIIAEWDEYEGCQVRVTCKPDIDGDQIIPITECMTCGQRWPTADGVGCPTCVHGPVEEVGKVEVEPSEIPPGGDYPSTHPWFFKLGGVLPLVSEVKPDPARVCDTKTFMLDGLKRINDPKKKLARLQKLLEEAQAFHLREVASYIKLHEEIEPGSPYWLHVKRSEVDADVRFSSNADTNLSLAVSHLYAAMRDKQAATELVAEWLADHPELGESRPTRKRPNFTFRATYHPTTDAAPIDLGLVGGYSLADATEQLPRCFEGQQVDVGGRDEPIDPSKIRLTAVAAKPKRKAVTNG